jgi:hypothetical protein
MRMAHCMKMDERKSKEHICDFAYYDENLDYLGFIKNTPNILAGKNLREIVNRFEARKKYGNKNIIMLGAHVIKCGLQPYIAEMIKRGLVDCIAVNGAVVIHDVEFALYGKTSEDVANGLISGEYASTNEPLDFINNTLNNAPKFSGYGYSIGKQLFEDNVDYIEKSLLAIAYQYNIPLTVHIAIGTDINQLHDSFDVQKAAYFSYRDFETYQSQVNELGGGIIFNCGSAVILPEVFLKALSISRNNGINIGNFMGVNLDFQKQYRSNAQIVEKAKLLGGQGFHLIGHHEIQIPLLFGALIQSMEIKNEENN